MRINQVLSIIISVVFCSLMQNAKACSSCGSSATSPLVLNPDENLKMYFGISENLNFMDYGAKGADSTEQIPNQKITSRRTLTLAIGYRTTENSFVTLTGSGVQNQGPIDRGFPEMGMADKQYLMGDPILAGRYNLVNMDITNTYRPQVQLAMSYKPSLAKNMVDNEPSAIKTVGNGFHQVTAGVDFWFGMSAVQFGAAQFVTYSFDRQPNNAGRTCCGKESSTTTQVKRTRDLQYTTVLTVGYIFKEHNISIQSGAILDYIGEEKITNQNNNDGTQSYIVKKPAQSNSLFANVKYKSSDKDTWRLSYTLGGAYEGDLGVFTNSSQTTSDSIAFSYERTIF
ncbi:hypothetical protein [Fluviispira multicolorata]|uniref:Uncharacterized protein n=1 Tax=Fluviispira multicolorata TaxID=2654512 RepID=A0A833JEN1_9BACT|nr:hypothetical protein [Fluviispira multicolorata]KAB8033300.1 hypothetical protein GCL57_00975 [Fluviispira multicolorata]